MFFGFRSIWFLGFGIVFGWDDGISVYGGDGVFVFFGVIGFIGCDEGNFLIFWNLV